MHYATAYLYQNNKGDTQALQKEGQKRQGQGQGIGEAEKRDKKGVLQN